MNIKNIQNKSGWMWILVLILVMVFLIIFTNYERRQEREMRKLDIYEKQELEQQKIDEGFCQKIVEALDL